MNSNVAKSKVILNAIYLTFTNYGTLVFSFIVSFLIRIFLPPAVFGGISYVKGILSIFNQVIGIFPNVSMREVAILNSKNQFDNLKNHVSTSLTVLLVLLGIQFICFIISAVISQNIYLKYAFITLGVANIFNQIANYKKWVLTASMVFKEIAIVKLFGGALIAGFTLFCAYVFKETGYYIALIIASLINFFFITRIFLKKKYQANIQFNTQTLKIIIKTGTSITIYGFIIQSIRFLDRFYIEKYLGIEVLGIFSISYPIISMIQMFCESIINSYSPKIFANSSVPSSQFIENLKKLQKIVLLLSLIIISLSIVLLDPLLHFFLPQYVSAAIPIKIQLLGIVFINASLIQFNVLYGQNKISSVLKYFALLFVTSNVLFIIGANFELIGISMSLLVINIISYIIIVAKSSISIQHFTYLGLVISSLTLLTIISEINSIYAIPFCVTILFYSLWNLVYKQKIIKINY